MRGPSEQAPPTTHLKDNHLGFEVSRTERFSAEQLACILRLGLVVHYPVHAAEASFAKHLVKLRWP